MRLKGRRALVTGAANGIGLACAQEMAREGADVALVDLDAAGVKIAAEAIAAETGVRTLAIACDVADADAARAAVAQAGEALGVIDVLVNNAGILKPGDILTTTLEDFDAVLAVNVRAVFVIGQAVAQALVAAGSRA